MHMCGELYSTQRSITACSCVAFLYLTPAEAISTDVIKPASRLRVAWVTVQDDVRTNGRIYTSEMQDIGGRVRVNQQSAEFESAYTSEMLSIVGRA